MTVGLTEVEDFATNAPWLPSDMAPSATVGEPPPDARWVTTGPARSGGRCSLWWRHAPSHPRHRVGCIGHYAAVDDAAAAALLSHACDELRRHGCTLAVGPLDGSTWCNYRFVTGGCDRAPFWMEPHHPPEWPRQFARHDFTALAGYFSSLNERLEYRDESLDSVARRLARMGVNLRPVAAATYGADLRRIFQIARVAFRDHLLYSDLAESDFVARSLPLKDMAPLQLSWLAEHGDRAVGFVFAVPDLCERSWRDRIETVIVKTLAVTPDRAYGGLGQLLLVQAQQQARAQGFTAAIHALVRDVPWMRRFIGRYARPMRRYTLFAKVLTP